MSHVSTRLAAPLIVALSLFFALPALHAQEKTDLDGSKWRATSPGYRTDSAMTRELIPANPQALPSQTVDSSSMLSVVSSPETASVTDSSGGDTTETVLESPNADSQVGSPTKTKSDWDKGPNAWKVIVYPVYAWVPFFSTSVTLPAIPTPPGGGGGGGGSVIPSGTTSGSLNGAAFTGAEIYKGK